MSDLMGDLSGIIGTQTTVANKNITIAKKGSNLDLDMMDFVQLMIAQMTNQGIDDTMDTSEMLNQMVQMQMITSMVNMTDAVTTNYAASLVGKEVTVGKYGEDNKLQEIVGIVTATGTMDGQQVVFVNDEYYYLNEIMAVGRLPATKEDSSAGSTDKVEGTETPGTTETPEETEPPVETAPTETPEYSGEDGTPTDTEG